MSGDKQRDSRLAMLGSAVVALRAILPAANAIGALEDDSTIDEINDARGLADVAASMLTEFVQKATAATAN